MKHGTPPHRLDLPHGLSYVAANSTLPHQKMGKNSMFVKLWAL
jgi:hypothetical protein